MAQQRHVLVLLVLLCAIYSAQCSRILVVVSAPSKSHNILGKAAAKGLAEAGHDVTIISFFEEKNPPKKGKFRNVIIPMNLNEGRPEMNLFDFATMNVFLNMPIMNFLGNKITNSTLASPEVQALYKEHFDLIIIEQFKNDALKILSYHFKCPLITLSTMGATSWVNTIMSNPAPTSYIPELYLSYSTRMTFFERTFNMIFSTLLALNREFFFFPAQDKIIQEHFPGYPSLKEVNSNVSLVFLNSHIAVNPPVPTVPAMIPIGGYHVTPSGKLPKDLQELLDSSKEGFIYFSMGSTLNSVDLSIEKRQAFLKVFSKLKLKVLWKWEDEKLPGKPSNVYISKWFPQQDVLAHPNIKLFITHGGLLSGIETITFGVPVLVIPVFGDQRINAANVVNLNYGLSLDFLDISEESLSAAVTELLNNPKYRDNAKRRSKILQDNPVKPMDLLIYWSEYVIRHKDTSHLKVAGVSLPWYQFYSFDVIGFLVLVAGFILYIPCLIIKIIRCLRKSPVKKKKE